MAITDKIIVDLLVNTEKSVSSLKSMAAGLVGAGSVAAGLAAIKSLISDSIKAYESSAMAALKLEGALKAAGDTSEYTANKLDEYGQALAQTTIYDDDAAASAEALLVSVGKLGQDGIKKVLPLVADLATKMGGDLDGAAELVAKTLGTSANALKRQGVEFDNNLRGAERLDAVVNALNDKFGGMAVVVGSSSVGAMKRFSNSLQNLQELLGEEFAEGAAPALNFFTKLIDHMVSAQKKSKELADFEKIKWAERTAQVKAATIGDEIYFRESAISQEKQMQLYGRLTGKMLEESEKKIAAWKKEVEELKAQRPDIEAAGKAEEERLVKEAEAAEKKRLALERLDNTLQSYNDTSQGKVDTAKADIAETEKLLVLWAKSPEVVKKLNAILIDQKAALEKLTETKENLTDAEKEALKAAEDAAKTRASIEEQITKDLINQTDDRIAILNYEESERLKALEAVKPDATADAGDWERYEKAKADITTYYANERAAAEKAAIEKTDAANKAAYDALVKESDEANAKAAKDTEDAAEKEAKAIKDIQEAWAKVQEQVSTYGGMVQEVLSAVSDFMGALSDQQVDDAEAANEEQLAGLKERLDAGLISEEEYNDLVAAANEDLSKKKRKIAYDEAVAEKAFKLFDIAINTAAAIVKALPNIPLAIATGVVGAIQAALVLATPLPALKEGGIITRPTEILAGEAGPEAIVPLGSGAGGMQHITIYLGSKVLYDDISRATAARQIQISRGSLV